MFDYRVISIGSLSHNPFWDEKAPVRPPHATTTLIVSDDRYIIVDPALPAEILIPRLKERAGIESDKITDVFLTNFRPAHRHGLAAFTKATWWISEAEREAIGLNLIDQHEKNSEDESVAEILRNEIALLNKCKAAPDKLADHVDLFPLPGFTPGTCGLLLTLPGVTILVAGDAISTSEHLSQGRVQQGPYDLDRARQSFAEAIEIADWIIPAHDNILPNITRRQF